MFNLVEEIKNQLLTTVTFMIICIEGADQGIIKSMIDGGYDIYVICIIQINNYI